MVAERESRKFQKTTKMADQMNMDTTGQIGVGVTPPGLTVSTVHQAAASQGTSQSSSSQDILSMIRSQFEQMNTKMDSNTAKAAQDNSKLREDVQAAILKVQDDAIKERKEIKEEVLATVKGEMVNANAAYAQAE